MAIHERGSRREETKTGRRREERQGRQGEEEKGERERGTKQTTKKTKWAGRREKGESAKTVAIRGARKGAEARRRERQAEHKFHFRSAAVGAAELARPQLKKGGPRHTLAIEEARRSERARAS